MEIIFDFMLLAASGSAAVYCFVLNRKLQRLKDTEKGLGATIASMAAAVEQAQAAVADAKQSSAESVNELTPLVAETREFLPKLTALADSIGGIADTTIANINEAALAATKEIAACLNAAGPIEAAPETDNDNAVSAAEDDEAASAPNAAPSTEADRIEFSDPEQAPAPGPPQSAAGAASTAGAAGAWMAARRSAG
jgi:ABC-type transporter Mla subunit MlaD